MSQIQYVLCCKFIRIFEITLRLVSHDTMVLYVHFVSAINRRERAHKSVFCFLFNILNCIVAVHWICCLSFLVEAEAEQVQVNRNNLTHV